MKDQQTFNYIDHLQTSPVREQQSMLQDSATELQGRLTYIFLLDKTKTELDEVYGSEKYRRVYLPHFTQRAIYKTNIFSTQLNLNIFEENEEKLEFVFNFDRMVHNIRELKDKVSGTLTIKNKTKNSVILKIEDNRFVVKIDENILLNEDLTNLKTIKSFVREINAKNVGIVLEYVGNNEEIDLLKFNAPVIIHKGKQKEIQIEDDTYGNRGFFITPIWRRYETRKHFISLK